MDTERPTAGNTKQKRIEKQYCTFGGFRSNILTRGKRDSIDTVIYIVCSVCWWMAFDSTVEWDNIEWPGSAHRDDTRDLGAYVLVQRQRTRLMVSNIDEDPYI